MEDNITVAMCGHTKFYDTDLYAEAPQKMAAQRKIGTEVALAKMGKCVFVI